MIDLIQQSNGFKTLVNKMCHTNNVEPSLSVNDMVQFSHLQTDP